MWVGAWWGGEERGREGGGRCACMTCLSMPHSRMQLIQVAGHVGVTLPATPPPLPRQWRGSTAGNVPVHRALK